MVGQTISYGTRAVMLHRKILRVKTEDGVRYYIMRDLDNPEAKQLTAVADIIDHLFATTRGVIREDKYSDSPFQKRRKKAGGF